MLRTILPISAPRSPAEFGVDDALFTANMDWNTSLIESCFSSDDLVIRPIYRADSADAAFSIVYLSGMAENEEIARFVVSPLQRVAESQETNETPHRVLPDIIAASEAYEIRNVREALKAVLNGDCLIMTKGTDRALGVNVRGWPMRQVWEAESEPTERGPKEGFTEDLQTNVALIRRRLRTERLKTERVTVGEASQTQVSLLYLGEVAREEIVEEVRSRISKIKIDAVLDANYIRELISDAPWSPFPTTATTERPDRAVAEILEGHIVVIVDGSPTTLIAPATFAGMLQSPDDYYRPFYVATFIRELRWLALYVGVLAPSVYVSILSYHSELIPTLLLFTLVSGREGIPLPPVIEALLMETAFELLREAALRMPRSISPALSIVGALVVGDAAVRAGIISPLMIVVVGMTALSTLALPVADLSNTIRLLRFPLMILAGLMGLFGVLLGVMLIMAFIIRARSFGIPYYTPFTPYWEKGMKDVMIRAPLWMQRHRPWYAVQPTAVVRQPKYQRPGPDRERESGDPQ